MAEFIKVFKLIHNSIIITSIALILIALPNITEPNPYEEGLNEINALKKSCFEIINYEKDYLINSYNGKIDTITNIFSGLPFEPFYNRDNPIADSLMTIEGVYKMLMNPSKEYIGAISESRTEFDFQTGIDKEKLKNWYIKSKDKLDFNSWSIIGENILFFNNGKPIPNNYFRFKTKSYVPFITPERNKKVLSILKSNKIIVEYKKTEKILPKLKHDLIWTVVKPLNLTEAEERLNALSKKEKKSQAEPLSIFGFSIPSFYASTIGPSIIIILLTFLLTHLIEFSKLTKLEGNYPWVGIYKNKLARIIFFSSIILLPISASLSVISLSDFSQLTKWTIGVTYLILIVLIGRRILIITTNISQK